MTNNLQYPIGLYQPQPYSIAQKKDWLAQLSYAPQRLETALQNLDASHLQTPYRQGGWTLQQLAHHIADSHTNGYLRTKLALTENNPTIKPYNQDAWVTLTDTILPYNLATTMLHVLHIKWVNIFNNLSHQNIMRTYMHPVDGQVTLWYQLGLYAWHSNHHIAHIINCKENNGW